MRIACQPMARLRSWLAKVLSARSAQQGDVTTKFELYAKLGIPEVLLVDPSGRWLSQRLLRIQFQASGGHHNDQDADGGVTSELGFRLILDADGQLRVLDAVTGYRYRRPEEAEEEAHCAGWLAGSANSVRPELQSESPAAQGFKRLGES